MKKKYRWEERACNLAAQLKGTIFDWSDILKIEKSLKKAFNDGRREGRKE